MSSAADLRAMHVLRQERYECGLRIDEIQKSLGSLRRQIVGAGSASEESRLQNERAHLRAEIDRLHARRQSLKAEREAVRRRSRDRRQDGDYQARLQTVHDIDSQAEFERLRIARSAYLVAHSLEHGNVRPTAWWLPMVSPDGSWFRGICRTVHAYLEEL